MSNIKYTKEILEDIKEKSKTFKSEELKEYIQEKYGIKLTKRGYASMKNRYKIHCFNYNPPKYSEELINYAKKKSKVLTSEELRQDLQKNFNIQIKKSAFPSFVQHYKVYCTDYEQLRKYNKEILEHAKDKSKDLTIDEMQKELKDKFNFETTRHNLQIRLYEYGIYCKNDKIKPIGHESKRDRGRTVVKIDNKPNSKHGNYEYKHRLMYEKYHNVKLTNDDYIIFLDGNRTNYDKNNLYRLTRREINIMNGGKLYSTNRDLTKLGILSSKLMLKAKNM